MTSDLELLRAYEPVIRYTNGELFYPTAVEPYLAECDLLVGTQQGHARLLIPRGGLDETILASQSAPTGETLYLRLVQQPLGGLALAQWSRRPGPSGLPGAGATCASRPVRPAGRRGLQRLAPPPGQGPGRNGGRSLGQVRDGARA